MNDTGNSATIWNDDNFVVACHDGWIAWVGSNQVKPEKVVESIRSGTPIRKAVGRLGTKLELTKLRRITLMDDSSRIIIKRKMEVSFLFLAGDEKRFCH